MDCRKRDVKDCYISVRCTEEEKKKIKEYTLKSEKTMSRFVVDSCLACRERRTDVLKRCLKDKVCLKEQLNQIKYAQEKYSDKQTEKNHEELMLQIEKLGGVLKCRC